MYILTASDEGFTLARIRIGRGKSTIRSTLTGHMKGKLRNSVCESSTVILVKTSKAEVFFQNVDFGSAIVAVVDTLPVDIMWIKSWTHNGVEVEELLFVRGIAVSCARKGARVSDQAAFGGSDWPKDWEKEVA